MEKLKQFWTWANGKKSVGGCILLVAGTVIAGGLPPIPAIAVAAPAVPWLVGIGGWLGGGGLFHKLLKAMNSPGKPQEPLLDP